MKLLTVAQLQTRVYAQKETNLSLLDGLFCQAKDAGSRHDLPAGDVFLPL